jgi:hypothetical protein
MPRKDGTGPLGNGGKGGTGGGQGGGQGGGLGGGRGGGRGMGVGGDCVCTSCGATASHDRGAPCATLKCPKCGSPMTRKS